MVEQFAVPAHDTLKISKIWFERMASFVTSELGIKMSEAKINMIQSRVLRRIRELELGSMDDYCQLVFGSGESSEELIHFIDAVTTNKTDFFREAQHFRYLTEVALPQLGYKGARNRKELGVWSAVCSSGEEPYTLAMVLSEFGTLNLNFDFRIFATDISTRVLNKGMDAIYTRAQIELVPKEWRRKYFLQCKTTGTERVRIKPNLRERVSFRRLNLMDPDYCVRDLFDIIFCRNVLMYFDPPTQEAVINKLCRNLSSGGYLFISHSESLSGLQVPLVALGSSCFRKP